MPTYGCGMIILGIFPRLHLSLADDQHRSTNNDKELLVFTTSLLVPIKESDTKSQNLKISNHVVIGQVW